MGHKFCLKLIHRPENIISVWEEKINVCDVVVGD